MPPTIFGLSSGLFNKISIQIPAFFQGTLDHGTSIVVGDGQGINGRVHIADLAELYEIVVVEMLARGGQKLPVGKKAIMFAGSGEFSWLEAAERVAQACFDAGKIKDPKVQSVSLAEATQIWGSYRLETTEDMVEAGLSGNSRTVPSIAMKRLGWKPSRGDEAWEKGFADDLEVVLQGTR